jgi:hypothetical protein
LRVPTGAQALEPEASAVSLAEHGDLAVVAAAQVVPMYADGADAHGRVVIRRRVSLEGLRERLEKAGVAAAITGLPGPFAGPVLLGGEVRHLSLNARVPFEPVTLQLDASRERGGGAATAVGIVLMLLGAAASGAGQWLRRRATPVIVAAEPTPAARLDSSPKLALVPVLDEMPTTPLLDELPSLPMLVPLQPEVPSRGEAPADRLVAGRYRIIHPLGTGSVSEVYLAQTVQQLGVPKVVALKLEVLPPGATPEQLLESAQLAARVQHPNVVRMHDFGVADQRFFVAMEFVEGCSARCLLDELRSSREHMPIKQALSVAIAMCKGLEAAHATQVGGIPVPVVHRDLRPSSVLIGLHGAIKLAGFGAFRPRPSPYTAPEQARVAFDARADLYAVGMILHELLTGEQPGANGRSCSWMLRKDVPRSLEAVLVKATQPTPRRRYASAALLRADLEDISEMIAEPPSSGVLGDWVERVRRSHG